MPAWCELSGSHPADVFEVLRTWVKNSGPDGGAMVGHSQSARVVLRAALAHPPTEDTRGSFIQRLGAAGHLDFRDLLEG